MARPKTNFPFKRERSSNGANYGEFESGEFLTLSADPQRCYIVGGVFNRGQVIDTLANGNWAAGTRFTTEVDGETIEYEVSGKTLMKVISPSN